ncbi:MAG: hypothetical protein HZB25_09175 [Candidatus Eisenbacteria bacterium]|nr:hypothetical protein [Candidatus Eisenbacteria bacterium]
MSRVAKLLAFLGAAVFAAALARVSGFFTDDSYIHLVFARNLAAGLGPCFNPGEPVYGFTSPLWVLGLAAGHAVSGDWLALSRGLGLLFTLLAVAWTYRLARAAGGSTSASLLAAAGLALHAWFLRWSLSGMETSLAAFTVALGLERLLRGGRAAAAGLAVLALAALARPEAALLFALGAGWALTRRTGRAAALAGTALGLALLVAWVAWAHGATGAWLPSTFTVKRAHEPWSLLAVARPTWRFLGVVLLTDALAVFAAVAAFLRPRARADAPGLGLLLAWPAALAALYLATRFQMISRYWVPALPALLVAAAVGPERAFGARARHRGAAAYFAQQLALLVFLVVPGMDAFTRGLGGGPAEIGRWLRAHSAPDAVVATPDIGAVGYYSGRRVLDLGGLVTPAMAPLLARHDLGEIVRGGLYQTVGRADYLVDRDARPGALAPDRYELRMTARVENLGLSRPHPVYYSLYRVRSAAPPAGAR